MGEKDLIPILHGRTPTSSQRLAFTGVFASRSSGRIGVEEGIRRARAGGSQLGNVVHIMPLPAFPRQPDESVDGASTITTKEPRARPAMSGKRRTDHRG
jgi:hypothetical protein